MYSHFGPQDWPCSHDYECWQARAASVLTTATPGLWYSPLEYGDCSLHPGSEKNCTWQTTAVTKVVSKQCHSDSFMNAVQAHAPAAAAPCFAQCAGGQKANASDPCWIRCFYMAILGPDSGKPNGTVQVGVGIEELTRYWKRPFESSDPALGGCPALPPMPPGTVAR